MSFKILKNNDYTSIKAPTFQQMLFSYTSFTKFLTSTFYKYNNLKVRKKVKSCTKQRS